MSLDLDGGRIAVLNRLEQFAQANGKPIHSLEVRAPMIMAYDKFGEMTASVTLEKGITDHERSEVRREAMFRGWQIR